MLEEVLADTSVSATVVALNIHQIDYMLRMMYEVLGFEGTWSRQGRTLTRADGRTITFRTRSEELRGLDNIYIDHAVV